jgi:hypothetical protein
MILPRRSRAPGADKPWGHIFIRRNRAAPRFDVRGIYQILCEVAVAMDRERPGGDGGGSGQPLCQALDHRTRFSRHQGPALRHGLSSTRIGEPTRRDRLLLVSAFAMALLTLLGAVGESLGMDRQLKSNTAKTRSHSLFRQGCMLYELIPNMPEHRLAPLIAAFAKAVSQAREFGGLFAYPE